MLRIVSSTTVMMREPPGLPSTRKTLPSFSTKVGAIEESGRLPGAIAFPAARVDDSERIADCDRRVDRIAALGKDPSTDLGGVVLGRNHHAVLGLDRRRRGCFNLADQHPGYGKDAEEPSNHLRSGDCASEPAGTAARHTVRLRAGSASAGIP